MSNYDEKKMKCMFGNNENSIMSFFLFFKMQHIAHFKNISFPKTFKYLGKENQKNVFTKQMNPKLYDHQAPRVIKPCHCNVTLQPNQVL